MINVILNIMNDLLGIIEIFYICLGGLLGYFLYSKYNTGVGIYIIMGIILGPPIFNCVSISYLSTTLSSLGILFVLFEIGLHLSYEKILLLKEYLVSSSLSIVLSIVFLSGFLLISSIYSKSYMLIGILFSISSTPIVFNILQEKNKLYTTTGRLVFTTMLLQDIVSIILLVNNNNTNSTSIFFTLLKSIGIFLLLFVIGKKVINEIFKRFLSTWEFILLVAVLLIIGLSLLTEFFHLSLELGAVFAGFLLAETEYATFIESQIIPVKEMLVCLFFMTVGMFFPFQFALNHLSTCILLFLAISICKFIGLYLGHRLILNNIQSIKGALMLLSVGEVMFIFINRLFVNKISPEILNYLRVITVFSFIITPLFLRFFYYFYKEKLSKDNNENNNQNLFIIGGLNKITCIIIEFLQEANINYICLEKDIKIINNFKNRNFNVKLMNYYDIKNLQPLLKQHLIGILFSEEMDMNLIKQIKQIKNINIYVKINNKANKDKYIDTGIIPIYIDAYDEAYKVCEMMKEDFLMDHNDLENIFLAIK